MTTAVQTDRTHSSEDHTAMAIESPYRIASTELLRGKRKLIIEHGETTYVLLLTRNGKLILNKKDTLFGYHGGHEQSATRGEQPYGERGRGGKPLTATTTQSPCHNTRIIQHADRTTEF